MATRADRWRRVRCARCAYRFVILAAVGAGCMDGSERDRGSLRSDDPAPPMELDLRTVVDGHAIDFGAIGAIAADDEGRIYVVDTQAQEIVVLGPDGRVAGTIGGRGEGPSEFAALRPTLAVTEDAAVTADWRNSRVTAFDRSGSLRATRPWPSAELGMQVPTLLFAGGNTAYGVTQLQQPAAPLRWEDPPSERPAPEHRWVRFAPDGSLSILPVPPGIAPRPWPTGANCGTDDGFIHILTFPFADRGPLTAFLPDGHLAVARPGAWEIEIIELDTGTAVRRHQRAVAPLPLSDEQWEAQPQIQEIRAIERERGPVHGQGGTACPILEDRPQFFPVIRTLLADETGRLWVEATTADGLSLTIIDAEGRPVGEAAMPRRDPRVTPYVRGNILYLVTVDDLDVQSIEVYEARFVGQLQDRS